MYVNDRTGVRILVLIETLWLGGKVGLCLNNTNGKWSWSVCFHTSYNQVIFFVGFCIPIFMTDNKEL